MFQGDILSMNFLRRRWIALALFFSQFAGHSVFAEFALFGSGSNQFTMEFVTIGNPNNVDDTTGFPNPAGKVEYTYRMGKFEVSESMITKFNASQSIQVSNSARGPDKPTSSISWNSAARFVNWLNTSQGYQAAYNFTTSGSNDPISLWNATDAWQLGGQNLYRHKDARYWLPSMDEWYKAAYYDPNKNGGLGGYWNYPTGSDSNPISVASGSAPGTAVYSQLGPADVTMAGGLSPFGIMGMGGNVWEWEETAYDLLNDNPLSPHGYRGEAYNSFYGGWHTYRNPGSANAGSAQTGFRVASLDFTAVPEPSSLGGAIVLAASGLMYRRRRVAR
jgi:formylglycine-generating enzyme